MSATETTITVRDLAEGNVPEGATVYVDSHAGRERVGYIRWWPEDPWIVCPDANAGFGISYAVHAGTTLVAVR